MADMITLKGFECQMCGHQWVPRNASKPPKRCVNKECKSMRWDRVKYPNAEPPTPTPKLRGKKLAASEKGRRTGITLNSPQPQLRLPLHVAAAVLFSLLLFAFWSPEAHAVETSSPLFVAHQGDCQNSSMPAKNPLRKVVHRSVAPFMPYAHVPEYLLCFVTETLECGHTLEVFPQSDPLVARYRRCGECASSNVQPIVSLKKPPASVRLPDVEKKRA